MYRAASPPPRQGFQLRAGAIVLMALTLIGSLTAGDAPEAAASAGDESTFVAALNDVRRDAGLPPFTVNVELSNLSRAHAQVMADAGEIFHASPISAGYSGPWSKIGENVGVGANVAVLVDAFVASPGHYANIIDPAFTEIGVGVVWKDSALYTTHRFLQVHDDPPTTTTAPPVPTTTVPTTTTSTAGLPFPTTTTEPPPAGPAALAPPDIDADRIVTLLEMVERVGT